MNKEWKEKWVEALRSGKYKQGKHRLKSGDEYCCLGVLCDIHPDVKFELSKDDLYRSKDDLYRSKVATYKDEIAAGYLPKEFAKILEVVGERELANMNDDGKSFNEIADWIEENL